jgi:hypothetical protein
MICGAVAPCEAHTYLGHPQEQRLRAALLAMVYEATHLSPERDDGSHDCRISAATLRAAREALA